MEIGDYIKSEETKYRTHKITVIDGYKWSMYEHIRRCVLYLNSQFETGPLDEQGQEKPFFNVILAVTNLQKRSMNMNTSELYIGTDKRAYMGQSFLLRLKHKKWVLRSYLGTVIDRGMDDFNDLGLVIMKRVKVNGRVEIKRVPLTSIAFCDQGDVLSAPFCEKHIMSESDLEEMRGVWDDDAIEKLKEQCRQKKTKAAPGRSGKNQHNEAPSGFVEVYELRGFLPSEWLDEDQIEELDKDKVYVNQVQIGGFHYEENSTDKKWVTCFKSSEDESPLDAEKRDEIDNRACGRSGVEEQFDHQVWVNWDKLAIKKILEAASRKIFFSLGAVGKNLRTEVEHMDVLQTTHEIREVPISTINTTAFENNFNSILENVRRTGGSAEPISGEQPNAGTPFRSLALMNTELHDLHKKRKQKYAMFWERLYQKWVIPDLKEQIKNDKELAAELDPHELQWLDEQYANFYQQHFFDQNMHRPITQEELDAERDRLLRSVGSTGSQRFLDHVDELFDEDIDVYVDFLWTNERKNNAEMTDKVSQVLMMLMRAPQLLDDPRFRAMISALLESSGMDVVQLGLTGPQSNQQGNKQALMDAAAKQDQRTALPANIQ